MMISIIIPTFNEVENMIRLQKELMILLKNNNDVELIIVDGNSTDDTVKEAKRITSNVFVSPQKGRAAQMNYGASLAKGSILYFVHADVSILSNFQEVITDAVNAGTDFGCFRYNFDSKKRILKFNAYLTRYNAVWAGGGDQTLFIRKNVFQDLNGFNGAYIIMEDFDLVRRAKKKQFAFRVLPFNITVSARKYDNNSWLRVQLANIIVVIAWKLGASQHWMKNAYRKMLH